VYGHGQRRPLDAKEGAVGRAWTRRRWRRTLAWGGGALAAGTLVFLGYMKLVELAYLKYNKWDRRERGTLSVGDQAPDLELSMLDGKALRLSELWRAQPAVLIFGSCT
jgi:hypothetical protein